MRPRRARRPSGTARAATAALVAVVASALAAVALSACANHCSGHGTCGANDKCSCFIRFTGEDCSQRKCHEAEAWVGGSPEDPRAIAECSNQGICDRDSGECMCYPGYTGGACERSECPNDCSGHGTCEFLDDLSGGYTGTFWDISRIQGCKCDPGWTAFDCSLRMCPRGDDPLTVCPGVDAPDGQCNGQVWTLTYSEAPYVLKKSVYWQVQDTYGEWFTSRAFLIGDPLPHGTPGTYPTSDLEDGEADQARAALEDMDWWTAFAEEDPFTFTTGQDANTRATSVTITFKLRTPARINTVILARDACSEAGCYPLRDTPSGSDADLDAVVTTIATTETSLTEGLDTYLLPEAEYDVCSNRGLCDEKTGKCHCFQGHTGLACEEQSILT